MFQYSCFSVIHLFKITNNKKQQCYNNNKAERTLPACSQPDGRKLESQESWESCKAKNFALFVTLPARALKGPSGSKILAWE